MKMKKTGIAWLVLTMVIMLTACGKTPETVSEPFSEPETTAAPGTTETAPETEAAEEENDETYVISAFGLELKYPAKWKDKVTVEAYEGGLAFSCGDIKLFDLLANSDEGIVLGTVRGDEYTVISVADHPIDSDDADILMMQEDVNVILNNLKNDYDFILGEVLEKEDATTFDIETSVVTLKYPEKWRDRVQIDVAEDCVKFSADDVDLFDLVFTECDGYLLGTYGDTPVYIVDYPVDTDEQADMQEDVNVILQDLMLDSNFVLAP